MRRKRAESPVVALLACLGLALALPSMIASEAAAVPTEGRRGTLAPMPQPDLSAMDEAAQAKVRSAQAAVEGATAAGVGDEELADAWGYLGQLYHAFRLLDAAETSYANAAALVPSDHRWAYYLALVRHAKGELEAAVAGYARTLELRPNQLAALVHQGNALVELDRGAEAAERFERALELDPESAAARFGLAKTRAFAGEHQRAVELFEEVLERQPEASEVHYPLGQSYRRLGDLEKAREHLQQRGQEPVRFPDPLGDQILRLEKGSALEVVLSLAREGASEGFSEEDFLGFALSQFGDVKGTIEQLRQGLALQPAGGEGAPGAGERARIHYVLGGLLVNDGRDEEAIQHFTAAVELDPKLVDTRVKLGNALARQGRLEEAVAQYTNVLERRPEATAALLKRAAARMALGRDAEARADLEQLTALEPGNSEAQIRLGAVLARQGALEAALERYRAAAALDLREGERLEVETRLGALERARGNLAAAEVHYRRVLELDPGRIAALGSLGSLLAEQQRMAEAADAYGRWTRLEPTNVAPRLAEATALILSGQHAAARDKLEATLEAFPGNLQAMDVLARHLAACPDLSVRDGARALELAQRVYAQLPTPESLESLAMAHAQAGRYAEAAERQRQLIEEHGDKAQAGYLERLRGNLALYEAGRPCCVE